MKKLALCGLFLAAWAHAQVSYEALKAHIHSGTAPEEIRETIVTQGLGFEVDITLLRQMKADRMPDWLIDFLIEYNPSEWVSRSDAPRRYVEKDAYVVYDDDEPRYYRWNRTAFWGLSPWNCVDWFLYAYNPWAYCNFGSWGYAGLGLWWPYYRNLNYIYNRHYYYDRHGRVTNRGYRVSDRRVVGRAYPRGTRVSRAGTVPSRVKSTATRTTSRVVPRSVRASTSSRSSATRSRSSSSRSSATRSRSSSSRSSVTRSRSSSSRSSATRSRSSSSRSSATRSRSSSSRSSATRSRSSSSRSSAARSSRSSSSRSSATRSGSSSRRK